MTCIPSAPFLPTTYTSTNRQHTFRTHLKTVPLPMTCIPSAPLLPTTYTSTNRQHTFRTHLKTVPLPMTCIPSAPLLPTTYTSTNRQHTFRTHLKTVPLPMTCIPSAPLLPTTYTSTNRQRHSAFIAWCPGTHEGHNFELVPSLSYHSCFTSLTCLHLQAWLSYLFLFIGFSQIFNSEL